MEVITIGKLNVYLDTSVISHLLQEDVPEKMADTRQLWEMFCSNRYEVYLSTVTLEELEDCQHIAAAIISECDCIISWNFKHIVNIKTIRGVRAITNLKGHKPIEILNPSVLLESEE